MQNEHSLKFASDGAQPLAARLLLAALSRLREGCLEVTLPGGFKARFGQDDEYRPVARWIIRDHEAIGRILRRGDLGFAEAYVEGEWDTPNLLELLTVLDLNRDQLQGVDAGRWLARAADLLFHWTRRNSKTQSRSNIEYHYDLGNDFYRLWLDETMTYSAAIFTSPLQDLEAAQREKYRRLREPLNLTADSHLLEIGSGWGGFAIEAVKASGCRVTSITLSSEQLEEARRRAERAGVADRIEFRLQDYRDVGGTYDAIASCEMFEAVGEKYWPSFFRCMNDRLKPGGRISMQVITINDRDFPRYRKNVDFIQRHVFPGGMLPSPQAFDRAASAHSLRSIECNFYGKDYAETLRRWDFRVLAVREQITAQGFDDRFLRMWRYYLKYCEVGFRNERTDVMQVVLEHDA